MKKGAPGAEWLRARVTERRRIAGLASPGPWRSQFPQIWGQSPRYAAGAGEVLVVRHTWMAEAAHIIANHPGVVIPACDGLLAVLDEHAPNHAGYCSACCEVTRGEDARAPCRTVRLLIAAELGLAPEGSAVVDDLVGEGDQARGEPA